MHERTQFNVYLPRELVRAVRHAAVDAGTSLSACVQSVLEEHLASLTHAAAAAVPDGESR